MPQSSWGSRAVRVDVPLMMMMLLLLLMML